MVVARPTISNNGIFFVAYHCFYVALQHQEREWRIYPPIDQDPQESKHKKPQQKTPDARHKPLEKHIFKHCVIIEKRCNEVFTPFFY